VLELRELLRLPEPVIRDLLLDRARRILAAREERRVADARPATQVVIQR
jgi:hypothetical protein